MQNSTRPNKPELDATKVPTEIDIAWAAGVYEGEGCCRLCGRGKRSFAAAVVQKDPELLYRLRDWFGGSVNIVRGKFDCHVWDICGDRARVFIALIYRFMTARRRAQIDATGCLDFLGSESPESWNMMQLKTIMEKFYSDHREMIRLRKKETAKKANKRRYANPEYRANHLAVQQVYRDSLKKQKSLNEVSNLLKFDNTA